MSRSPKIKRNAVAGIAAAVVAIWAASSCTGCSTKYILQAGTGQAKLLLKRKPLDKVAADPATSAEIREKIEIIREAKKYGEDFVGIKKTDNYSAYVRVEGSVVSWNLMASPKLKLDPVTWHFPIVGTMPYLGYFKKADGIKMEAKLKKDGYDTYLRGAGAYSTLGWFEDPVFSSLLDYDKPILANVILHELTHTTVFIEGHVAYNEGLASFVGNTASVEFLSKKYGPDSPEVVAIRDYVYNDKVFSIFLKEVYEELKALYASNIPDAEKLQKRDAIFDSAAAKMEKLPYKGKSFRTYRREQLNNAAILSRAIYFVDYDMYEDLYAALNKDLKACIAFFLDLEKKIKSGEVKDPETYTRLFSMHKAE